jgi:hypothetical protein
MTKKKDKQLSTKHTHKTKDRVMLWIANIRYDIRMKTMFGSSLPLVVCRRAHVLLTLCGGMCCVHFIIITYLNKRRQWLCEPNNWTLSKSKFVTINVREYRRANQKCTIQRNCQHMVHKPKKNKTQDNMC